MHVECVQRMRLCDKSYNSVFAPRPGSIMRAGASGTEWGCQVSVAREMGVYQEKLSRERGVPSLR